MIKDNILFLSNSKKRTNYFNKIKDNCSFTVFVYYYSNFYNLKNYFYIKKKVDLSSIIKNKTCEIDFKYKYKSTIFKHFYKLYINIITPVLATNFYNYIKSNNIGSIAVWNGKKYPETIMLEIANLLNLKKLYFENGLLPNTTVLDSKGVNYTNSVPRESEFYNNYPINLDDLPKNLQPRGSKSKKNLNSIVLDKDYFFIPFQTSFDSQILDHSPWIKDMNQLFKILSNIAQELSINIIFKEHPSENKVNYDNLHKLNNSSNILFANGNSTQDLILNAKAIITINSSVGLESLIFNKKVIVLGEAFYSIDGIAIQVNNEKELKNKIQDIDNFYIDNNLRKKFLSYLINNYLVKGDWKNPTKEHFDSLETRLYKLIGENN